MLAEQQWHVPKLHAGGSNPWLLTNSGQLAVMADANRICLVDCQTPFKRSRGHLADCAERDAYAQLIASSPRLLRALKRLARSAQPSEVLMEAMRAIAEAEGGPL